MAEQAQPLFLEQCRRYPALRPEDLIKALHQSVFGCGHLVEDAAGGLSYLKEEAAAARCAEVEPLGSAFARVHLGVLRETGLRAETLFRLFFLSAQTPCGTPEEAEQGLAALASLADAGALPFSPQEIDAAAQSWRSRGYPACHHSAAFRAAYAPAYRVVRRDYARALPLLAAIDRLLAERPQVIVAIEGGSASGKTTLSAQLQQIYDCNVFHMDDFFLRPQQRTPQRYAEPGGNVDRERFYEEVLAPLRAGKPVTFRRYECRSQTLAEPCTVPPRALSIVEGAYSLHPLLADAYDLRVFLRTPPEVQRRRILKRNGPEVAQQFFQRWIPLEQQYFAAMEPIRQCDLILEETE